MSPGGRDPGEVEVEGGGRISLRPPLKKFVSCPAGGQNFGLSGSCNFFYCFYCLFF